MSGAELPPLRDGIARHGLDARKPLGQRFLLDPNLSGKIARLAGDLAGRDVAEVGPGPGGLTRALLDTKARRGLAVELDRGAVGALRGLEGASSGRLRVLEGRPPSGGRPGLGGAAPPTGA